MANFYDKIEINIEEEHIALNDGCSSFSHIEHFAGRFDKYLYKKGYYGRLIDSGMKRGWFDEFTEYWSQCLNGRPLNFHDFFFLLSHYRSAFQSVEVKENASGTEFMQAWQAYENIYLTFHSAYKYALHPFSYIQYEKYLLQCRGGRILEYGCGMAPVITSMLKNRLGGYDFTAADIRNFTFHYAKYRLKQHKVKFIDLLPNVKPVLGKEYSIVFLNTVLEHLPNPIEIIELLTESLKRGGYLFFDYILSQGGGLDTAESVKQRSAVLDFIVNEYELISGKIVHEGSMGPTVCRKK